MSKQSSPEQNWNPSGAGELSSLVTRLKRNRQVRRAQSLVGTATCLLGLLFVGIVYYNHQTQSEPLSHAQVAELLDEYVRGELDSETTARLEAHLAECDACRIHAEQLREKSGASRSWSPSFSQSLAFLESP